MAENSKIEWTDHTFNPWIGCQKVSPGCDHCYAEERMDKRFHRVDWGPHGARVRTSAANWKQPLKWNREAAAAGVRKRVFCASLADVFDNHASIDPQWRLDLWELIGRTKNLDWLLLTKRPQNFYKMLPESYGMPAWGNGWPNVWIGTTVENQEEANRRVPHLLAVPARLRFLSCEPLLGPVDLSVWIGVHHHPGNDQSSPHLIELVRAARRAIGPTLDWIICGGESGPGARPMHPDWARSLRDQCAAAGVAYHFKQWGEWEPRTEWGGHLGGGRFETMMAIMPDGSACPDDATPQYVGAHRMARVGKHRAGRLLDGVEHNDYPQVT